MPLQKPSSPASSTARRMKVSRSATGTQPRPEATTALSEHGTGRLAVPETGSVLVVQRAHLYSMIRMADPRSLRA